MVIAIEKVMSTRLNGGKKLNNKLKFFFLINWEYYKIFTVRFVRLLSSFMAEPNTATPISETFVDLHKLNKILKGLIFSERFTIENSDSETDKGTN